MELVCATDEKPKLHAVINNLAHLVATRCIQYQLTQDELVQATKQIPNPLIS